jgi:hypothetical protein
LCIYEIFFSRKHSLEEGTLIGTAVVWAALVNGTARIARVVARLFERFTTFGNDHSEPQLGYSVSVLWLHKGVVV